MANNLFYSIVENAPDPIFIQVKGKFAWLNPSAYRLFEAGPQELTGTPVLEYVHPDFHEILSDRILMLSKGHKLAETLKLKILHSDGKEKWIEVSLEPINYNGTEGELFFAKDITSLKSAETTLKLLSRSVNQSPVSIMLTDTLGNIEYVNPAFEKTTGYSLKEIKGENPRLLKSGYQSAKFYKFMWDTILSGKEWTGEFKNKKKNGELYWEQTVISPVLNEEGQVTNFVSIREDITERKKMVSALISAKEKAEESDRLKLAFLANMSHEMRTPMNGILGFAEILKDPGLSGQKQKKFIEIIQNSGKRMLDTINDLIDISKIETGQEKLYFTQTNLNDQIDSLFEFFLPQARQKDLQLVFNEPVPAEYAVISTDRSKIDSIFTNLIKNAIKFTDQGKIEVGCVYKDDFLEFYVKDTGIGIPANRQMAVFNRFEQADKNDVKAFQGSGLGLTISKSYVEMLGGRIWLESEEKKGSTFYFALPVQNGTSKTSLQSERKKRSKEGIPVLDGKTILIAEDDKYSSEMISYLVEKTGAEIISADGGNEALRAFHENSIDLVLLDIQLPGKNGYEVLREIRAVNPGMPVIAQTAYAMLEDIRKLNEAGFTEYLTKPISQEILYKLLNKCLLLTVGD